MTRTDLSTLTFGVEIEHTMNMATRAAAGWTVGSYGFGDPIPGFDGWRLKRDSSIHPSRPNHSGAEAVSPILRGVEGLREVERMVAQLNAMGAAVNESCGIHVHVGWNGTPEQLRRLICFASFHERALFAASGTLSRERGVYCKSIKVAYKPLEALQAEREIARAYVQRYHTLNLTNLLDGGKRTVEFRVFSGSLNFAKISAYIALSLAAVAKALDGTRKPLAWDAPAKRNPNAGDGVNAMNVLLTHLHWRQVRRRQAAGVLQQELAGSYARVLRRLARKYDAQVSADRRRRGVR